LRIDQALGGCRKADPLAKYRTLEGKGIKILFGSPTLDGEVSIDFMSSLMQSIELLSKLGIPVLMLKNLNSCYIDVARNLYAAKLLESTATHLWQADTDMSWNPEAILDMLLKDKDFIAGIGRKKLENEEYAGVNFTDSNGTIIGEFGDTEEEVLIQMKVIGGAFTLHKRCVFEKLRDSRYMVKRLIGETSAYVFYECSYRPHWTSEDYNFCNSCIESGIDIWCYPNIEMGHKGFKDYKGNWFKHLKSKKQERDDSISRSIDEILRMDAMISKLKS